VGFVLAATALVLAHSLGEGWLPQAAVLLTSATPVATLAWQIARGAAVERHAWWWMLGGSATLLVFDASSVLFAAGLHVPYSLPVAIAGTFLGYSLLLLGGTIATAPVVRRDPGGMLDVAIIGVACGGFVWSVWVRPMTAARDVSLLDGLPGLVLLLVTGAMVGLALRALVTADAGRPSIAYLAIAALSVFAGNLVSAAATGDPAGPGAGVEVCWMLANLALAAAVLHPAVTHVQLPAREAQLSARRVALLSAALAVFPVVDIVSTAVGRKIDSTLLSLATLVLVPLVMVRLAMLARLTRAAQGKVRQLTIEDELTGLPNRRAVTEHLADLLDRVAEGDSPGAAVLFCDLDDFTAVNDRFGYRTGDALLVEVAARLRGAARANGVVARFGGDEFLLVIEGEPDSARASGLSSIERVLEPPAHLDRVLTSTRASIGTAVVHAGERVSVDTLLGTADASMARVKRARRADRADRTDRADRADRSRTAPANRS
jgi:diguanylate cyclase (GGDEF)-like protein